MIFLGVLYFLGVGVLISFSLIAWNDDIKLIDTLDLDWQWLYGSTLGATMEFLLTVAIIATWPVTLGGYYIYKLVQDIKEVRARKK